MQRFEADLVKESVDFRQVGTLGLEEESSRSRAAEDKLWLADCAQTSRITKTELAELGLVDLSRSVKL